jgi:hypothetical protein
MRLKSPDQPRESEKGSKSLRLRKDRQGEGEVRWHVNVGDGEGKVEEGGLKGGGEGETRGVGGDQGEQLRIPSREDASAATDGVDSDERRETRGKEGGGTGGINEGQLSFLDAQHRGGSD